MRNPLVAAACMGLTLVAAGAARADDAPPQHQHHAHLHHHAAAGTPPPGKPRCIPHTDERAGYPRDLSGHVEPSITAGGVGSYIGGGVCLGRGDPRRRDEGTWGWDETGSHLFRGRALLGWSHGRKYQGGTGAYVTDGPHIPDPIYGFTRVFDSVRSGRP
jgi:hypothetical protein